MNLNFHFAKTDEFPNIQQTFKYNLRNSVMVLARDIPSTLETPQNNMPFPTEDDNTSVLSTCHPLPILFARSLTTGTATSIAKVKNEQKPQVVGYAFLGPCFKNTMRNASETRRVNNMVFEGGKSIDPANLQFDFPDDAGDGDSSSDNDSGYSGGDGDGDGSEAGSVESEDRAGSEGSAASYDSYGSQSSQGSRTSVSSAESGHNSDNDEEEDSDIEENDWDDDEDPYGEVEDDGFEFD